MIKQIFGPKSQILVGCIALLRGIGTVTSQTLALGLVFSYFLGTDPRVGMLVGGGVLVTYSAFGGVKAVIATDVIQCMILVITVPIVLYFAVNQVGGIHTVIDQMSFDHMPQYDLWGAIIIFFIILCATPISWHGTKIFDRQKH